MTVMVLSSLGLGGEMVEYAVADARAAAAQEHGTTDEGDKEGHTSGTTIIAKHLVYASTTLNTVHTIDIS